MEAAAARQSGLTKSGSAGYMERLGSSAARADVKAQTVKAIRSGEPFEFQGRILRADGEIRHVKSHGSIEMARGGKAVGIDAYLNLLLLNAVQADLRDTFNTFKWTLELFIE